jgi:predicted cobalt transporter CbtA
MLPVLFAGILMFMGAKEGVEGILTVMVAGFPSVEILRYIGLSPCDAATSGATNQKTVSC